MSTRHCCGSTHMTILVESEEHSGHTRATMILLRVTLTWRYLLYQKKTAATQGLLWYCCGSTHMTILVEPEDYSGHTRATMILLRVTLKWRYLLNQKNTAATQGLLWYCCGSTHMTILVEPEDYSGHTRATMILVTAALLNTRCKYGLTKQLLCVKHYFSFHMDKQNSVMVKQIDKHPMGSAGDQQPTRPPAVTYGRGSNTQYST